MQRSFRIGNGAKGLGALGVGLCLALAHGPAANAEAGALTAQAVIDRAEIDDLITRYYYNFGHASAESFAAFYADDAELVLGPNSYKGKAGIEGAYRGAGGAPNPAANRFSFNVSISNPLIVVHGKTATAQLIFTEIVIDKQGDAPRLLQQGREYDHLVKVKGQWRLKKRQIMPGAQEPAGWPG
jgi:hypothetical protein